MDQADARAQVEAVVEVIRWNGDGSAVVRCPGAHLHDEQGSPPMFWPDPPHITCFHDKCRHEVAQANEALGSLGMEGLVAVNPAAERKLKAHWKRMYGIRHDARKYLLPTLGTWTQEEMRAQSPYECGTLDRQFVNFLHLFEGDDIVWTGEKTESGKNCQLNFRTAAEWMQRGRPYGQQISSFTFKSCVLENGSRKRENVKRRRFLVLESDELDLPIFGGVIRWTQKFTKLRALVLTGGKLSKPQVGVHAYFDVPRWAEPAYPAWALEFDGHKFDLDAAMADSYYRSVPEHREAWYAACKKSDRWHDARLEAYRQAMSDNLKKAFELEWILWGMGADRKMLRTNLTARCPGQERHDDNGVATGRMQELIYLDLDK